MLFWSSEIWYAGLEFVGTLKHFVWCTTNLPLSFGVPVLIGSMLVIGVVEQFTSWLKCKIRFSESVYMLVKAALLIVVWSSEQQTFICFFILLDWLLAVSKSVSSLRLMLCRKGRRFSDSDK